MEYSIIIDGVFNNSNVDERGRNKKLGNFSGTTKKMKWINKSYTQPNENKHFKINKKDFIDSYISTINTYITSLNIQPLT